jgi:murein DD-endopeptidase MepM/ murein hydrolase activator NlpD
MTSSMRFVVAVIVGSLVAVSCGQFTGAHRDTLGIQATRAAGARDPSASTANGENSGPSHPGPGYIIVTVVKKVVRHPRVHAGSFEGPDPLRTCPVHGRGYYSDDFGAPRYAGGFHPHQGNDIFAALGTPIVAPFDGRAVATPNVLGGNGVTVYGAQGYVYNAHLEAYGKLGEVKAGTVIGYVGNSGDAMGGPYHDHFEWHPAVPPESSWVSPYGYGLVGSAVDPYPYLTAVCR